MTDIKEQRMSPHILHPPAKEPVSIVIPAFNEEERTNF